MAQSASQHETFAQWMADHQGIIVKIVRGFTPTPAEADDLTQEIAIDVWRSVPRFRGDSKVSTWIWRIALNRAISWKRGAKADEINLDDIGNTTTMSRSTDQADAAVDVNHIYQAIRTLNLLDRCLVMLSLEGYRYDEMADITGITETNVGARLSRARQKLTTELERV